MNNKDKKHYINLREKDNIDYESENLTLFNGNYKIIKEKDKNEKFHYTYNESNISKNILPIPNKKRLIKKDNKSIMNQKIENEIYRRKHSGIIKRAKNYQIYVSTSGRKQPKFTINTEPNGNENKSFSQSKNLLKRDNIKLFSNNYIDENKNIYKYNDKNMKMTTFQQSPKNNEYQISNKKYSLPKETINKKVYHNKNILKASDIKYNNFERNISNNSYRINLSNQKRIYRSPPSYNSNKFLRKIISPLRRNISKEAEFNDNIIILNNMNKIPLNKANESQNYPDNYKYHEIIHYNSPKKTLKTIENNENDQNCQYINKNKINYIINNNNKSQNSLRYNQSAHITLLIQGGNFTHLCESNKPIIVNKYLKDNHQSYNTFFNEINDIKKNCLSDYNSHAIENYEDIPKTIHLFGEQMLKKNINYNTQESLNLDISDKYRYQDEEESSKLKIPLSKDKSHNNIIIKDYNENRSMKSLPCDNSYNEDKNIIKSDINKKINKDSVSLNVNINRNRLNHNIINRKKLKKPVKMKVEDFISYNKDNNNNAFKEKINFCESIFDDKSIIDIIEEFEKEIEIEESEKNKKKVLNDKQSDKLLLSNISDYDMGNKSQNINKSKINKKHYYKTKNIDMEKNYDFMIYPTKKDKSQKK